MFLRLPYHLCLPLKNNTYMDQEVGGKGEAVRMIFRSAIAKKVPPFDVNTFPLVVLIYYYTHKITTE